MVQSNGFWWALGLLGLMVMAVDDGCGGCGHHYDDGVYYDTDGWTDSGWWMDTGNCTEGSDPDTEGSEDPGTEGSEDIGTDGSEGSEDVDTDGTEDVDSDSDVDTDGTSGSCDCDPVPSVYVVVTGPDGEAFSEATVTWSAGSSTDLACEGQGDGSWGCASGTLGTVTVVGSADGYYDQSDTVTVGTDGCDALTEFVVLHFGESDLCPTDSAPSVRVWLAGVDDDQTCANGSVFVEAQDGQFSGIVACTLEESGSFACATDVTGALKVYATADGYGLVVTEVTVEGDECSATTETIAVVLPLVE